ncbi:MAG: hypothetical protein QXF01_00450 [Candidatus Micrarchaeaceae archaeon]
MKAQMSFEFMVYLSMAGIGLLIGIAALASRLHYVSSQIDSYAMYQFVSTINMNIESGITSFRAYIPHGACNATVHGNMVESEYGTFYLIGRASLAPGSLCPDGAYLNISAEYYNGSWMIS